MICLRYNHLYYYSLLLLLDCAAIGAVRSERNGNIMKIATETTTWAQEENQNIHRDLDTIEFENCWAQIGNDIVDDGDIQIDIGASVDISSTEISETSDTQITLAVGFYGYAMMFNYALMDGYDGQWTPLGGRVGAGNSTSRAERFGDTVSLSADGRTVAVGIPRHEDEGNDSTTPGLVQVFALDASEKWTQLGQDIDGVAHLGGFGSSLELSDDGLTVIVGTDGDVSLGEPETRVFRYNGTAWLSLGDPITGFNSQSTSISSDGNIIAIGYPKPGVGVGITKVFEFLRNLRNGTWIQIGGDILGEQNGDLSGNSISLSSNGQAIAIGARRNNGETFNDGPNEGHVRIFEYSSTFSKWEQVGTDIDGENHSDNSGYSVSLTNDAHAVAIGAWNNGDNGPSAGHTRVYRYELGEWKQYGHDIDGESGGDISGESVSISPDGQVVAISSKDRVRIFANTNENCTITSSPSVQPTNPPSNAPSHSQTPSLSQIPSLSQRPTQMPTQMPNQMPTQLPVRKQTPLPTLSPSKLRSEMPSNSPSPPIVTGSRVASTDPPTCGASTRALLSSVFSLVICISLLM